MNLPELIAKVYIETARPDLVDETRSSVIAATMKMHGLEFFWRDLVAADIKFQTAAYIQNLDLSVLPRFRSFFSCRKWDPSYDTVQLNPSPLPPINNLYGQPTTIDQALAFFKLLEPDDGILDDYNVERQNVYYGFGNIAAFKSPIAFSYIKICWYQYPMAVDDDAKYSSWIADQFPYAIIYDAASSILQKIGQTDAARKYDQVPDPRTGKGAGLVWSHIDNLKMSNITARGY